MNVAIISILSALSVVSFIFIASLRRKLQQGVDLQERLQREHAQLDTAYQMSQAQLGQMRESNRDAAEKIMSRDKELHKLKSENEGLRGELQSEKTSAEQQGKKAEDAADHYKEQCEVLTSQIAEIDKEKATLKSELAEAQKAARRSQESAELAAELRNEKNKLRTQLRESKLELKRLGDSLAQATKRINEASPEDLKRAKERAVQYQHLYRLMRGQKEMLEERNANWEIALKMLSERVLGREAGSRSEETLGSLVATALEHSRLGPLVDDEFVTPSQESATPRVQKPHLLKPTQDNESTQVPQHIV